MFAFNKETLLIFALVAALFWVFYFYRENKKLKTDLAGASVKKEVVASAPVPTPSPAPAPKPPRAPKPAAPPPPPPKEEPEPEED
jgi:hypothetical protein